MELQGTGFVLRPPQACDLDAVVSACQDPEIPRFIPDVPVPYGRDDGRRWLEGVERAWTESDERTFAIARKDGPLLGAITVRLRDAGTVGYWLHHSARGQGLMTEALRAVIRWAGEEHGLRRLFLITHPENIPSQRVAERAGFRRVGTTRNEPPFRDGTNTAVLFELGGPP